MTFFEIGTDNVVQHIFSGLAGAPVDYEYKLEYGDSSLGHTVQGDSHQPPNKFPAREGVRPSHVWWLFAAMLLGESVEPLSDDEALCGAVR